MSKSRKMLLGILSFLPIVLLLVYIVTFFSFFLTIFRHAQQDNVLPPLIMENIIWMVLLSILMALCSLGLLIYFIIHAVNNKVIDSTERIIWILVFIFAGMAGFPVYWYMRIWKTDV
ncbi:MAG: hypothetical protein ABIQ88_01710 [Chitinophagaceae bacterium]